MKQMNTGEINQSDKYYDMVQTIVKKVGDKQTSEWLKEAPENAGKIENEYVANVLPVKGSPMNIQSVDNPEMIYPLLIKRSPGELVEDTCQIVISKDDEIVYETDFTTTVEASSLTGGITVKSLNLDSGLYKVTVNWVINSNTVTNSRYFQVGDISIPTKDLKDMEVQKKIKVKYDSSIPQNVKEYVNDLIEIIDPIMRYYVGEPNEASSVTLQYNASGFNGMMNNYTVLNTTSIPDTNNIDTNFDAFFFIEYFHMFHKGESMPFEEGRYSENISQLMKIIVSDHLRDNNLRTVSSKPLAYFTDFFDYTDGLGPNILINMGENVNGGTPTRASWEMGSDFGQFINVFTLDYGLSVWSKLIDARYQKNGNLDFVKEIMSALRANEITSKSSFYRFLDEKVGTVDNKKASEWIQETSLFKPLSNDIYALKLLPVNGSIMDIKSNKNPNIIYPFLVEREGAASILPEKVSLTIKDISGRLVYTGELLMNIIVFLYERKIL